MVGTSSLIRKRRKVTAPLVNLVEVAEEFEGDAVPALVLVELVREAAPLHDAPVLDVREELHVGLVRGCRVVHGCVLEKGDYLFRVYAARLGLEVAFDGVAFLEERKAVKTVSCRNPLTRCARGTLLSLSRSSSFAHEKGRPVARAAHRQFFSMGVLYHGKFRGSIARFFRLKIASGSQDGLRSVEHDSNLLNEPFSVSPHGCVVARNGLRYLLVAAAVDVLALDGLVVRIGFNGGEGLFHALYLVCVGCYGRLHVHDEGFEYLLLGKADTGARKSNYGFAALRGSVCLDFFELLAVFLDLEL